MAMIAFEHDGETYEADDAVKQNLLFFFLIQNTDDGLGNYFDALKMIFGDNVAEYLRRTDGEAVKVNALLSDAIDAIQAKN